LFASVEKEKNVESSFVPLGLLLPRSCSPSPSDLCLKTVERDSPEGKRRKRRRKEESREEQSREGEEKTNLFSRCKLAFLFWSLVEEKKFTPPLCSSFLSPLSPFLLSPLSPFLLFVRALSSLPFYYAAPLRAQWCRGTVPDASLCSVELGEGEGDGGDNKLPSAAAAVPTTSADRRRCCFIALHLLAATEARPLHSPAAGKKTSECTIGALSRWSRGL
jgi:hypothetical protein